MPQHTPDSHAAQPDDPLAIAAMILGAISFTGLGFITGIPAIILASVALARKSSSRNLSLAGLITGIISTILSIVAVVLLILFVVFAASSPEFTDPSAPAPSKAQPFSQSRV